MIHCPFLLAREFNMRDFIIRVIINAIGIALTAMLIPNIHVANNDIGTLLFIGLIFGVVNALVKPVSRQMKLDMLRTKKRET